MEIIEFSLPKLIDNLLSFEDYFLLYSLRYGKRDTFLSYVKKIKPIETKRLERLQDENWITFNKLGDGSILFDSIKLTDKSRELFPEQTTTFEECFAELKKVYPKSVGERKLHLDNKRSEVLYKKAIVKNEVVNITKHKLILKCVELYVKKQAKSGGLLYLQALPTYLSQQNWEAYMEEASKEQDVVISDSGVDMFNIDNKEDV